MDYHFLDHCDLQILITRKTVIRKHNKATMITVEDNEHYCLNEVLYLLPQC